MHESLTIFYRIAKWQCLAKYSGNGIALLNIMPMPCLIKYNAIAIAILYRYMQGNAIYNMALAMPLPCHACDTVLLCGVIYFLILKK